MKVTSTEFIGSFREPDQLRKKLDRYSFAIPPSVNRDKLLKEDARSLKGICKERESFAEPRFIPEIVFSGRSNVGKSSVINTLLNRKNFAKTSSTPGKTRGLNSFLINNRFCFVDLPGYGYAKISMEERRFFKYMVESYFEEKERIAGIVQIIDARHGVQPNDEEMVRWLGRKNFPFILVFNKADKLKSSEKTKLECEQNALLGKGVTVLYSSKTRLGRDSLWKWINERLIYFELNGISLEI